MSDAAPTDADERVKKESFFSKLMKKPELGAIAGVILVDHVSSWQPPTRPCSACPAS